MAIKRRKPASDRKSVFLRVRVTAEQKKLIDAAAAHSGISVSSWAVERLVRLARAEAAEGATGKR